MCTHLEKSGVKTERQTPQTRAAAREGGVSGLCSMATSAGRESNRTPLRNDGRIRLRTEWNGNTGDWELCSEYIVCMKLCVCDNVGSHVPE